MIGYDENGKPTFDEEDWQYAQYDMVLPVGTRIKTSQESTVILSFADMTTFVMKPESKLMLSSPCAKDCAIELLWGNLKANVTKMMKDGSMEIEMSQAVAGIKGTVLVIEETGSQTTLKVIEGKVAFTSKSNHNMVSVESGEMVTADITGLGEKTTFDVAQELAKWDGIGQTKPAARQVARSSLLLLIIGIGSAIVVLLSGSLLVLFVLKSSMSPKYGNEWKK